MAVVASQIGDDLKEDMESLGPGRMLFSQVVCPL